MNRRSLINVPTAVLFLLLFFIVFAGTAAFAEAEPDNGTIDTVIVHIPDPLPGNEASADGAEVLSGHCMPVDEKCGFETGWYSYDEVSVIGDRFTSTFERGGIYFFQIVIEADEGYGFSEKVRVIVNGYTPVSLTVQPAADGENAFLAAAAGFYVDGSETFWDGGFQYMIDDGEAILLHVDPQEDDRLSIPSKLGGYPLTEIAEAAFRFCGNVKELKLGTNVKDVCDGWAFYGLESLEKYVVFPTNRHFTTDEDGALYGAGGIYLIAVPPKSPAAVGEYSVREGVRYISGFAMESCSDVTGVRFPDGMTEIPNYTFLGNHNLKTLSFPNSMKHIGEGAFWDCPNITDVWFRGTRAEWTDMLIEAGNEFVRSAELHCDIPFTDVPRGTWYTEAAVFCDESGLIKATSSYRFMPESKMNRSSMVMLLARLDGADLSGTPDEPTFADVTPDRNYYAAAEWAYREGYTAGTGTRGGKPTFSPNVKLTREQTAQFLYNYTRKKGGDVSASAALDGFFDHEAVSAWACGAVSWAVGSGLMSGTGGSYLSPQGICTRAQTAVMVMKYVKGAE